ncbi:MAG: FAD-dependent oxidoreductase [Elusimicrobia bacterium]|nr:FAD-dependent oxidoreductase [Elusimicrobiota bacterium]
MPEHPLRIVILGGGFAGLACAQRLERLLHDSSSGGLKINGRDVQLILIARDNYFNFQPLLADVVGGSIEPRHVVSPLRRLLPLTDVRQCEIESIDLKNRRVNFYPADQRAIPPIDADHLVLALGQATDFSRIPGMAEHALALKNLGDALRIRNHVVSRLEEATLEESEDERRRLLTFVVVGAGFSGVEVAGQINDLASDALRSYPRLTKNDRRPFRVIVIQKSDRILQQLDPDLSSFALQCLKQRGIEIKLSQGVAAVKTGGLRLDDGEEIKAATMIATVGNTIHPLLAHLPLKRRGNRIEVLPTLEMADFKGVWASGDCAAVPSPQDGWAPEMAQFAVREGRLLADNLIAAMKNRTLKKFSYKSMGQLASLGHHQAVAQVFSLRFGGIAAWWLWRTVYLFKLPGIDRRLRVLFDWTLDLLFSRDIVKLNVSPTSAVSRAHYEAGETIFKTGDPSQTFYIVEKGTVELLEADAQGRSQTIAQLGPGSHLGERSLIAKNPHALTARAATAIDLLTIHRADFTALANNLPPLRQAIEEALRRWEKSPKNPNPLP